MTDLPTPHPAQEKYLAEIKRHGLDVVPGRATVHRVLIRNGLVSAQEQEQAPVSAVAA